MITFYAAVLTVFWCFFVYTWCAFFGLATFGSKSVPPDLMSAYNPKRVEVFIGKKFDLEII